MRKKLALATKTARGRKSHSDTLAEPLDGLCFASADELCAGVVLSTLRCDLARRAPCSGSRSLVQRNTSNAHISVIHQMLLSFILALPSVTANTPKFGVVVTIANNASVERRLTTSSSAGSLASCRAFAASAGAATLSARSLDGGSQQRPPRRSNATARVCCRSTFPSTMPDRQRPTPIGPSPSTAQRAACHRRRARPCSSALTAQ